MRLLGRWKLSRSWLNGRVTSCDMVGCPRMWPRNWLFILSSFDRNGRVNQRTGRRRVELSVKSTKYSDGTAIRWQIPADNRRRDLLHRYTPTPYGMDLLVMAKTVRLETNCLRLLESALGFFARHQG